MARYNQDREREREYRRQDWRPGENRESQSDTGWREDERGFFHRVGDEVRSWFGDEEAENRRWRDESRPGQPADEWPHQTRSYSREYRPDYPQSTRRGEQSTWSQPSWRQPSEQTWRSGSPGYEYDRSQFQDWRRSGESGRDAYGQRYPESWSRSTFPESRSLYGTETFESRERNRGTQRYGNFVGRGPRNYKRSDERILEDVNEQLTQHPMIDATEIEVSVVEAEVTLRGSVDNRSSKRLAEDVAESVSGVRNVRNEIRVQGSSRNEERVA